MSKEIKIVGKVDSNVSLTKKEFNPFEKASRKKVVILGTAPTMRHAPFGDLDFDIWGVAHCCFLSEVTRIDAIFEIHKPEVYDKDKIPFQRFPNAMIYFGEKDERYPNSQKFPLDEIVEKYKVNKGFDNEMSYFSNSLSYMVCLAIEKGYEEIHVYGVHLLMEEEYFFQRPNLEYYLGIAIGKGIKVYRPAGADILTFGYLYGFQEKEADTLIADCKERIDEFDKRLVGVQQNIGALDNEYRIRREQLMNSFQQMQGARENTIYILRKFGKEIKKHEYVKF